jgi:hypothetical protein
MVMPNKDSKRTHEESNCLSNPLSLKMCPKRVFLTLNNGKSYLCFFGCGGFALDSMIAHYKQMHRSDDLQKWHISSHLLEALGSKSAANCPGKSKTHVEQISELSERMFDCLNPDIEGEL